MIGSEKDRWEHALVLAEAGDVVDLVLDLGLSLLGLEELLEFFLFAVPHCQHGVSGDSRQIMRT